MAEAELLPRFDYDNATKDTLEDYATSLNLKLDMSKPLKTLVEQVKKVEKSLFGPVEAPGIVERAGNVKPDYLWLRHKTNGRVYQYTEALHEHGLIPCEETGALLPNLNDGEFIRIS
jgi:hypothetical protein